MTQKSSLPWVIVAGGVLAGIYMFSRTQDTPTSSGGGFFEADGADDENKENISPYNDYIERTLQSLPEGTPYEIIENTQGLLGIQSPDPNRIPTLGSPEFYLKYGGPQSRDPERTSFADLAQQKPQEVLSSQVNYTPASPASPSLFDGISDDDARGFSVGLAAQAVAPSFTTPQTVLERIQKPITFVAERIARYAPESSADAIRKVAGRGISIIPFAGTVAGAEFDTRFFNVPRPVSYASNLAGDVASLPFGAIPVVGFPASVAVQTGVTIGIQDIYARLSPDERPPLPEIASPSTEKLQAMQTQTQILMRNQNQSVATETLLEKASPYTIAPTSAFIQRDPQLTMQQAEQKAAMRQKAQQQAQRFNADIRPVENLSPRQIQQQADAGRRGTIRVSARKSQNLDLLAINTPKDKKKQR